MPENELMEGLIPAGLMGPPKLSSCVGIYIAPDSVHLAAAGFSGGKPAIVKTVSVPLAKPPAPAEGAAPEPSKKRSFFNTDFLSSKEILAGGLAAGLQELGARTKDVVVTLAPQISITRYFLMPPVDKRFWKAAVPSEAKKYIPFPLDGLMNDYQVRPPVSEAKKNMLGVLFGVTPSLSLAQILGVVRAQGLNPIAVEPSHCSVMRYWSLAGSLGAEGEAQLRVHFDPERAFVILTRQGLPLLCREVDLPSDEYALQQKKLDLAGALDFSERYLGIEQVARVRITGAANEARNAMISREVELPAEKEVGAVANTAEPRWGTFAAAGAGLRSLAPSALTVDFTQNGRMRDEDKTLLLIWGIGFAVFLLFTLLALVNEYQIIADKQRLAQLTRKAVAAGVTRGMTATDLRNKISEMKTLNETMQAMAGKDDFAPKLQSLADDIPQNAWLESVEYADSLVPGAPSQKTLALAGGIQTGDRESDILVGNQFKDALQKDPVFFKGFAQIDISYSGASGASGNGGPTERKTTFTLSVGPAGKQ